MSAALRAPPSRRLIEPERESAEPSSEYKRHHPVSPPIVSGDQRRDWWRVETRLDDLRAKELIDECEWFAARRLRLDEERACGARASGDYVRVDHGPVSDGLGTGRIAAVTRVREAQKGLRSALGMRFAGVIQALPTALVEDWSWPHLAGVLGVSHHTAQKRAVAAFRELALVYQAIDGPARKRAA